MGLVFVGRPSWWNFCSLLVFAFSAYYFYCWVLCSLSLSLSFFFAKFFSLRYPTLAGILTWVVSNTALLLYSFHFISLSRHFIFIICYFLCGFFFPQLCFQGHVLVPWISHVSSMSSLSSGVFFLVVFFLSFLFLRSQPAMYIIIIVCS